MIANSINHKSRFMKDPRLPQLAIVLDESAMVEEFNKHFRDRNPTLGWKVIQCTIKKTHHHPAKHCRVLYLLRLQDAHGGEKSEWFYARFYTHGMGHKQFQRAVAIVRGIGDDHQLVSGIEPVDFCNDLNMILWVFPYDSRMRALTSVVDLKYIRKHLEANLDAFGLPNGPEAGKWHCTEINYDRIKYAPRKRCVLRFHANLSGPSGATRQVHFFSKSFDSAASRKHFELLKLAYDELMSHTPRVNMARPLLHLDDCNTFWQEELQGKPLIDVIDEYDWNDLSPRIARMMASLHGRQIKGLPSGPSLDDIMRKAEKDGRELRDLWSQNRKIVDSVLDRLRVTKSAFQQEERPLATIHGAFRMRQMVVRDTELGLVDFDAIALGDPLFDVAEFMASMHYQELKSARPRAQFIKAADLCYSSYKQQVPWPCDDRCIAWYVLAFLMTKMLLSVKNSNYAALEKFDSAGVEICNYWLRKLGLPK